MMNKKLVCILDYGSGNVKSVYNMFSFLNYEVVISNDKKIIKDCSHIVLPGVGAFGLSMKKILQLIPFDILENEVLVKGKPFLGICLGMQVLADEGNEFGNHKGFGWIGGSIDLLKVKDLSIPHIGWNEVNIYNSNNKLLNGLNEINDFYFVHSYVFNPSDKNHIGSVTNYGNDFVSSVNKDNIFGVQFHPEKSHSFGLELIKCFVEL